MLNNKCRSLLLCSFFALTVSSSWASLTSLRPFDSDRTFGILHKSASSADFALSPNAHQMALSDFDNRISESFKVPAPLKDTVSFWLRIYTEYSTEQTVLLDKKHPEVVYEVMDFSSLKKTSRNAVAYELNRERKLKKRMSEYRAAFASLIKKSKKTSLKPDSPGLSPLEKKLLVSFSQSQHSHPIKEWNAGFRVQTGQRDQVVKGLLSAEAFFPKMEEIFEELDVPRELTRIPLVESSFNIRIWKRIHEN
jgi:membrane-bound lytic murein transglycosylase D